MNVFLVGNDVNEVAGITTDAEKALSLAKENNYDISVYLHGGDMEKADAQYSYFSQSHYHEKIADVKEKREDCVYEQVNEEWYKVISDNKGFTYEDFEKKFC